MPPKPDENVTDAWFSADPDRLNCPNRATLLNGLDEQPVGGFLLII